MSDINTMAHKVINTHHIYLINYTYKSFQRNQNKHIHGREIPANKHIFGVITYNAAAAAAAKYMYGKMKRWICCYDY